jgi:acyl-coenzyme A thioesterase PaaI-like protein
LKLGRSLVFGEVAIYADGSDELAANVTTTYAPAMG